jgi:hypothetical protein
MSTNTITATKPTVTLNHDQGIYVIPCGGGVTCLGFDVCRERAGRLAEWLKVEAPAATDDLMVVYQRYEDLMAQAARRCKAECVCCLLELTPQLIGLEGMRVEVVDCNGETRRFKVGRSTGWIPVHLEIKTSRSHGGMAAYGTPYRSVRVVGERV